MSIPPSPLKKTNIFVFNKKKSSIRKHPPPSFLPNKQFSRSPKSPASKNWGAQRPAYACVNIKAQAVAGEMSLVAWLLGL